MRTIITLKPTADGKTHITREQLFNRFKARSGRRIRDAAPIPSDVFRSKDATASTLQRDIQELLERGFDVEGLKAGRVGLKEGGTTYKYSHSAKNPVGVEVLIFNPVGGKDAEGVSRSYAALSEMVAKHDRGKISLTELFSRAKELGFSKDEVRAQFTDRMTGTEAKDLFIGSRGLSQEREDMRVDKAYDSDPPEYNWKVMVVGGVKYTDHPPRKMYNVMAPNKAGAIEEAAALFYEDFDEEAVSLSAVKGSIAKDSVSHRRRIVIHNYAPRAKDAPKDDAFQRLVNKVAKEMDADSDYYETVSIAQEIGATPEQAKEVAHELGRRP